MNRETDGLRQALSHVDTEIGGRDSNVKSFLSPDQIIKILLICKDDGLRWYDGKRDKFVEIEL